MKELISSKLLDRYNISVPRYTSYPPASSWMRLNETHLPFEASSENLGLYIHIPFCNALCHYCGCSSIANKNTVLHNKYLQALLKEIRLLTPFHAQPLHHIHFGGGTPNIFSQAMLNTLLETINDYFSFSTDIEIAVEVDPRIPTNFFLLASQGVTRVSLGVQDIDQTVQEAIGRRQSKKTSEEAFVSARKAGLPINIDLIYGLPFQTQKSFAITLDWVKKMAPDRIALFSFAYLPEIIERHRNIPRETLLSPQEKFFLFLEARNRLLDLGYVAIGLDHFALPHDQLAQTPVHRSFQGYAPKKETTLGIGLTAISDFGHSLFQNTKDLTSYFSRIDQGILPIERGAILSQDDLIRRDTIDQIMCQYFLSKSEIETRWNIDFNSYFSTSLQRLIPLIEDSLVSITDDEIRATTIGTLFLRNIAACFDEYTIQGSKSI